VEKFLDTPVKRYSSGMYVRLAFAVAAHLEPEILIVDEVLAVGDAEFQKKCLGKMKDVSTKEGRTVLFVSHNLTAVKALCKTGLLLQKGQLLRRGSSQEVLDSYLSSGAVESGRWARHAASGPGDGIRFEAVDLVDSSGSVKGEFDFDEPINIRITATASRQFNDVQFAVRVTDQEGYAVFTTCDHDEAKQFIPVCAGAIRYSVPLPVAFLSPGRYTLQIATQTPKVRQYDLIDNEISFVIHDIGRYVNSIPDDRLGVVNPIIRWQSE
jgi:lipopolysaccharide transport system ATP-binding protein